MPGFQHLLDPERRNMFEYQLLLFLLVFNHPCYWCQIRRTIKNLKYPFPSSWAPFAEYKLEVGDRKEATACWKYRTFSYYVPGTGSSFYLTTKGHITKVKDQFEDHFQWGFSIGWKTGFEADNKQAGIAELFISHDNQTKTEEDLQNAKKTRYHLNLYEDWQNLFEWQSVCYAISIPRRTELIYVNGKFIMGYEWEKKFSKGWGNSPLYLQIGTNWKGEVTDLNIYDSAFDDEELIARTTSCEKPAEGEIFAWNPEKFNLTNNKDTETMLSEVSASELCSSEGKDKNVLEVFDNGKPKSPLQSEQICARLNGKLNLVPVTEEEGFATLNEIIDYVTKVNITGTGIWLAGRAFPNATEMIDSKLGYQTYPKDGRWTFRDPYNNKIIGVPFITVPSGMTYPRVMRECASCEATYDPKTFQSFGEKLCRGPADCVHKFKCASQLCDRAGMPWGPICRFEHKVRLRLKGLCAGVSIISKQKL